MIVTMRVMHSLSMSTSEVIEVWHPRGWRWGLDSALCSSISAGHFGRVVGTHWI